MIDAYTEIFKTDNLLRQAIYVAFDGKCFYTGRDVPVTEMDVDHIKPLSKGGRNCIANYVMTCQYINLKKSDYHSEHFEKVVTEVVSLVFAPKVLKVYSNISHNRDGFVQINDWLRGKGIREGSKEWLRVRNVLRDKSKLPHINRVLSGKSRGILLFREEDLEHYLVGRRGRKPSVHASAVEIRSPLALAIG